MYTKGLLFLYSIHIWMQVTVRTFVLILSNAPKRSIKWCIAVHAYMHTMYIHMSALTNNFQLTECFCKKKSVLDLVMCYNAEYIVLMCHCSIGTVPNKVCYLPFKKIII